MMWYGGFGAVGLLGPLAMVLFWAGVILLVVWALRTFSRGKGLPQEGPQEILKRRLAAGELTHEQYEQSRKAIEG